MTSWLKTTISVDEAINLVTSNITFIRKANNKDEILSYELDKVTKCKVDLKSNQSMLGQLASAYREHADVLKDKGCDELARQSWEKADEILFLHKKRGANSIVKAGGILASIVPKAGMCFSSTHSNSPTTSPSICTTSPVCQLSITLTVYFDKDVNPLTFDMPSFPSPNCHLQDTRQLGVCLTLLNATNLSEDNLSQEERKWLLATRSNKNEIERLKKIANDVVGAFIKADIKDSEVIAEVIPLAFNLERSLHRRLLNSLIDVIDQSTLLDVDSLDGLAQIIQSADPGFINSDDLVSILRVLNNRLQKVHSEAVTHRYCLVFLISRVLDAMAAANVGDVDRINLHDPLASLLDMSKSNTDPYLSFQVEYATQALLNVSNDEKPWHAGFRRLWLTVSIGASFAKVPDPKEIKSMLEGLEKLYNEGRRDFITLKEAINGKGRIEFTFKDGLQFKSIWYRAFRTAELYIQTGKLTYFEEFVLNTQCRDDRMFQVGVCQLLGQFVVDTRWELKTRQSAVAFIKALYQNETIWTLHDDTKQVIYDILFNLDCNYSTDFEDAKTFLVEMRQLNSTWMRINRPYPHPWAQSRVATNQGLLEGTLLSSIQTTPDMNDIQSALKSYYTSNPSKLSILRVSGDPLPLETCFVNLAIVEVSIYREQEKKELQQNAAIYHRILSSEFVQGANLQSSITLEQLFDRRKLCNEKEDVPKRILVQGRAGIGKTTLCKKLVHLHQNGLFRDRFDIILWLPLRELKIFKQYSLESLLSSEFNIDMKEFVIDLLQQQQHVIITSRPSGVDRSLLPPIDLELETIGFHQQNVNDYLINVLEPETVVQVQEFFRRTPLIRDVINIPVQLDVICFCWGDLKRDDIPITMTRLYQQLVLNLWRKDAVRLNKKAGGELLTANNLKHTHRSRINDLMAIE
ncbi:hypothetical protein FBU30_001329, partial [Linnemannia zychae]